MPKHILLISALVAVGLSAVFSVLPVGIYNQAQVSALYPTLFTPAGFTFSIWSIIYASWIILGIGVLVWRVQLSQNNTYLFASTQILSSLWLLPSQFLYIGTSLIVMLSLLYLLILNFFISRSEIPFFKNILELFLGWIIVASIANIHITLVAFDIYFFPLFLTLVSIIWGGALILWLLQKYNSYMPSLVLIWACFGIIVWQSDFIIRIAALWILVFAALLLVKKYQSQLSIFIWRITK